ncbi:hypothetical protein BD408DRAFT_423036 [Parasitella parasitica]|nr:hypothetical protein BD408DRAFT_423036 [Parasitella parasitica]
MPKACIIQVNHCGERKGFFKITGLGPSANQLKFTNEEGVEQTVAAYFIKRHNSLLNCPFLPLHPGKEGHFFADEGV